MEGAFSTEEQHQSNATVRHAEENGAECSHSPMSVPYYMLFSHADVCDYFLMLVGGIAAVAHGASIPVFYIFFSKLIDTLGVASASLAGSHRLATEVPKYCLYFLYLSCVRLVSGWLEISMWMYTADRQSARIRIKYTRALITQDVGFFDTDTTTSQAIVGISSDTALIQEAIGPKTGNMIYCLSQCVGGLIVAFYFLWKLSLVTIAVMPIFVAMGGTYAYVLGGISKKSQVSYVQAGGIAQEVFSHIRTVQSFVGEEKAYKAYSKALLFYKHIGKRSGLAKGLGISFTYGVGLAIFALLFWYAGKLVRNGDTDGGQAFATILNLFTSCASLGQAAPNFAIMSKAKVSGYTVLEMIKRTPVIANSMNDGLKLKHVDGSIELKDVTFSYPSRPNIMVFQKFSLSIPAGKVAAIVGSSGSGKSTVIALIERFYDPKSGEVLLDGNNIKNLQLNWLRGQMGLVNQEPALFSTSILKNITYGKDGDVSMNEVVRAASISWAHDFIDVLPERYDTEVGERGVKLSGGQKQRIAIARAILKNPSILLLDEATSALDAESEKYVQKALNEVMQGRTTVVVAHRLSTIQNADMIAVVQEGRVVEVGSHTQLLKNGGAYAALVNLQKHTSIGIHEAPAFQQENSGSLSQRSFSLQSISADQPNLLPAELEINMNRFQLGDKGGSMRSNRSFKKFLSMNIGEWPYGVGGAIGALVAGSQLPLFAWIITQALEYFYSPNPGHMKSGLVKTSLLLCGLGGLSVLGFTCEFYFAEIAGENITMRMRKMLFSAILRNEISWFDENNSMLLSSCLLASVPLVRVILVDRVITLLQNVGLLLTASVIALKLQWKMALVMISTLPALAISQIGQLQFSKGLYGDVSKAYMKASMVAGEAVSNIRTVAAFSAEDKVLSLFCKELEEPRKQAFVRGQIGGLGFGISEFFLFSSYALDLWYGSKLMQKGEADFGQVMKTFMVLVVTGYGIAEALTLAPDILKSNDVLHDVLGILERRSKIDVYDVRGEEPGEMAGAIAFKNVDFSYPTRADVQVFSGFNLSIDSGKSMAVVGPSGSGKSSLIALIVRFYDPQHGQVMVDGRDIKTLQLMSLRQRIGLVQQEPVLFSASIYDNIQYGREGASEAEVIEAARDANAHEFISGLPCGYKTEVGERGLQLSGGQRQRVAIARAVLRNPVILLLDEATSALDAESEKVVQEALERVMQGRTTVLVAHRLSTVKNADSIAVLQNGCIAEQGTHAQLLAKKGAYFQLLNLVS